jgi:LPXTG-motif cell wall-anchored protein
MKIARVLVSLAAVAVFVLIPQAAFACNCYGSPGPGGTPVSSHVPAASSTPGSTGVLPSTGSGPMDAALLGAGLLLLAGGGAVVVASRRKQFETV